MWELQEEELGFLQAVLSSATIMLLYETCARYLIDLKEKAMKAEGDEKHNLSLSSARNVIKNISVRRARARIYWLATQIMEWCDEIASIDRRRELLAHDALHIA